MLKQSLVFSSLFIVLAGCGGGSADPAGSTGSTADSGTTPDAPENTYVPDFTVGDLSFKQVWVPDVGQSGFEFKVWFDLSTKKAKQKVFVNVDFVRLDSGNASDLNTKEDNFFENHPKIPVGGIVIDKIDPEKPIHVEQAFTLPANLPDGKYAAIFGINQVDFFPDINQAQGETPAEDAKKVLVAPATVIVGKPTKPNLRVLSSSLSENYFTKPVTDPSNPSVVPPRHIQVNLEVDSMALDTTKDVDVEFKLELGGTTYALEIGVPVPGTTPAGDATTGFASKARWTYKAGDVKIPALESPDVEPDEVPLHSTEPIAVATQMPIGKTFDLYLPDSAWNALTADAVGNVIVTIDPDNKVDEWGSSLAEQKGDNVKKLPIQFLLAAPVQPATSFKGACHTFGSYNASQQYANIFTNLQKSDSFGNSSFGVGYGFQGVMSAAPTSVKFGTYNYVSGKVFGFDLSILDANAELDADLNCGAFYQYDVKVLGISQFSGGAQFDPGAETTLWDGSDKYKKSKTFEKEQTFMVCGIVPIFVSGGITGTIGVEPKLSVGPALKLTAQVGPYVSLDGEASGGVDLLLFRGGLGIELLILKMKVNNVFWVELPYSTPKSPAQSPYSELTINYKMPLEINSLDGRVYLFADYRNWLWKWKRLGTLDIVSWKGLSWTYDIVPTKTAKFAL